MKKNLTSFEPRLVFDTDKKLTSEKGSACIELTLALIVAVVLLLGWLFVLVGCSLLLIKGINLQTKLNRPQRHYLHRVSIEQTELELGFAVPSKVIPDSPTWVRLWVYPTTGITTTQVITVSTRVSPPLFVKQSSMITFTISPEEVPYWRMFDYECIDLEIGKKSVQFEFSISADIKSFPQAVEVKSPLDMESVRRQVISERIWWILGMILAAIIPIIAGYFFRK